ncbi:TniB family NTP-binding protein [Hansschlegelia quercus]|uniref:AAA+ ATPase domain-containing protein n=1 Tax=Hansschlegelia quercus TaxID=2528245 RepID=A0A4V2JEA2_9HYPH|nr:TniB family NTP-binding protein [Hansschlegelia quercus]TBN54466.1 hypothetical protein EYR15_06450 [Hansschlegelia quercus]
MIAADALLSTAAANVVNSYVPVTERDKKLASEVDRLVQIALSRTESHGGTPPREAPGLLVVGASGAGKTTAIHHILGRHPRLKNFGVEGELCPMISFDAPAPTTLLQLGRELLRATGYPIMNDPKRHIVWEMVRDRLRLTGVVAIHIDEFHNVTRTANSIERDQILATLKSLLNDRHWPVALLLSGLPEVVDFVNADPQVARRMRAISFSRLVAPVDVPFVGKIVVKLTSKATCPCPGGFSEEIAPRLIHAADGSLGILVEIIVEAIGHALRRAEPLCIQHFEDAYALRTACSRSVNPFAAEEWETIEVTRLLATTPQKEPAPGKPPRGGRKA